MSTRNAVHHIGASFAAGASLTDWLWLNPDLDPTGPGALIARSRQAVVAVVGVIVPTSSAWSAADLSFEVGRSRLTQAGVAPSTVYWERLGDLWSLSGEVTVPSAAMAAGRYIALPVANFMGIHGLRLRSGTAASPVAQAAATRLDLVTSEVFPS